MAMTAFGWKPTPPHSIQTEASTHTSQAKHLHLTNKQKRHQQTRIKDKEQALCMTESWFDGDKRISGATKLKLVRLKLANWIQEGMPE